MAGPGGCVNRGRCGRCIVPGMHPTRRTSFPGSPPLRAVPAVLLSAALLVALAGCDGDTGRESAPRPLPPSSAAAANAPAATVLSADGTWRVQWRTDPAMIPLDEPFAVEVHVTPADGDALEPEAEPELAIDARMPHHRHGMLVRPTITRTAPGRFRVEGLMFHMPGYWELHFDVVSGGVVERAQASVEIEG